MAVGCLYQDQASSWITFTNNICYMIGESPDHQHFGWQNLIQNNILAFGGQSTVTSVPLEGGLRTDPDYGMKNSFTFLNNIIYFVNGTIFCGDWQTSTNPPREYSFDYNLYYSPNPKESYTFPNDSTFQQWQSQGQDPHSIIQQDPLFDNANAFNFTLQGNSPALTIGFKQIDTTIIGPKSTHGFTIPPAWRGPLSKF